MDLLRPRGRRAGHHVFTDSNSEFLAGQAGLQRRRAWAAGDADAAGVIGSPIEHSLSPGDLHRRLRGGRARLDLRGATRSPERRGAGDFLQGEGAATGRGVGDDAPQGGRDPGPRRASSRWRPSLGAVNCVVRDATAGSSATTRTAWASSTRCATTTGWTWTAARCVVVGAGGAGRAVALAPRPAGASEVVVVNRSPARADAAAGLAGTASVGWARRRRHHRRRPRGQRHLCRHGRRRPPAVRRGRLVRAGQVVVDLVYHPRSRPLLRAAAGRGRPPVGGLGMLVHQAAHQYRALDGRSPDEPRPRRDVAGAGGRVNAAAAWSGCRRPVGAFLNVVRRAFAGQRPLAATREGRPRSWLGARAAVAPRRGRHGAAAARGRARHRGGVRRLGARSATPRRSAPARPGRGPGRRVGRRPRAPPHPRSHHVPRPRDSPSRRRRGVAAPRRHRRAPRRGRRQRGLLRSCCCCPTWSTRGAWASAT